MSWVVVDLGLYFIFYPSLENSTQNQIIMSKIKVGLAQIAPVWLNKKKTTKKIIRYIEKAAKKGCDLVTFGETILPGYPFWLDFTDASRFNSDRQKDLYANYLREAVSIEKGDLDGICSVAKSNNIAVILGIAERAADRGNHSVYCTLVYIHADGNIAHTHRKLMPTYEERLCWAPGDGNGLQVQAYRDSDTLFSARRTILYYFCFRFI